MSTYSPTQISLREQNQRLAQIMRSRWFKAGVIALMVVSALSFVVETNALSTKGYTISALEKNVTELENQTRQLEAQIARYQSLSSIKERIKDSNLVAVGTPEFLEAPGTAIAKR